MLEALLPILGFMIGTIASMVGVGGGIFIVPLLTLFFEFPPRLAVGTSLATIIFTSSASTANYSRQKRIYYKIGLVLATVTVPGSYLGAYMTSIIEEQLLGLTLGAFLLFVALRMIFKLNLQKKESPDREGENSRPAMDSENSLLKSKRYISLGLTLSFFGGLSSGLLGLGGGSLLVPIMVLAMNMPIHIAVATSMFTMVFTSTSGVVKHLSLGNIDFRYSLLMALGTIFGAQLGARTSKRISSQNLKRLFGAVLIVIGIRMIIKYV